MVGQGEMFNAEKLAGFNCFRTSLIKQLEKLPIVGIPIEKSWVTIRVKIEEHAKITPYISNEELWTICNDNGVVKQQDQKDLSQLFHDLGIFLHYQEDEKPSLLNRMVILQKDWATKAVYMVLKSELK